jgi:chromosome segregation ATPase
MTLLAIDLTLVEIIALPLVIIIFGFTLYFFIKSRKTLQQTLKAGRKSFSAPVKESSFSQQRNTLVELEEQFAKMRYAAGSSKTETPAPVKKQTPVIVHQEENMAQELKNTIAQQQKLLNTYLKQVEQLENEGKLELRKENDNLQREITKLHGIIDKKDEEIEDIQQQAEAAQKMAAKIEEVYQEFDLLQEKMQLLERQASRANNLAIELEDTRQSYEQVHKELLRKQDKLEEVMNENQRMRMEMNTLEDKLAEANLQRQQLQKKVQFLTDLNTDMQSISETNKKLQTELRRIGELESMLNMMAEERDFLLRKKMDK